MKWGVGIREMLLLAEQDSTSPNTLAKMRALRDQLWGQFEQLQDLGATIFVVAKRIYPHLKFRERKELVWFAWGAEQETYTNLTVGIIIDGGVGHPEVRPGYISFFPKVRPHVCGGCTSSTPQEYRERNEDSLDQMMRLLGFPSLVKNPIWDFQETEAHALEVALQNHWENLREACMQQEYLTSEEDLLGVIQEGNPFTPREKEKFVFGFLLQKEFERLDGLADDDELPNCHCSAAIHREALTQWQNRSLPA